MAFVFWKLYLVGKLKKKGKKKKERKKEPWEILFRENLERI